jgi:hypothetical protein
MREAVYREIPRTTLKITGFVGVFSALNLGLRIYRQQDDMLNVAAAGAVTGALFRAPGTDLFFCFRAVFVLITSYAAGARASLAGGAVGLALGVLFGAAQSGLRAVQTRIASLPSVQEQARCCEPNETLPAYFDMTAAIGRLSLS